MMRRPTGIRGEFPRTLKFWVQNIPSPGLTGAGGVRGVVDLYVNKREGGPLPGRGVLAPHQMWIEGALRCGFPASRANQDPMGDTRIE
jgi:hypothetical protein